MKHYKILLILLTAALIALLAGLGIYITVKSRNAVRSADQAFRMLEDLDAQISGNSAAPEKTVSSFSPDETAGTDAESVFESFRSGTEALSEAQVSPAGHHLIFVGDSRTVGMGKAEAKRMDTCTYIGESGEGYRWFTEIGLDLMDEAIRKNPGVPVVFNLGVNDCDQIDAYIDVYHEIEKAYPQTDFYYMSVNPVTEDSPHVPLSDVLDFNRVLKENFPVHYIDTCTWMLQEGFEDVDGVHYSEEQYCAIHDFAVRAVSR